MGVFTDLNLGRGESVSSTGISLLGLIKGGLVQFLNSTLLDQRDRKHRRGEEEGRK